jgi:hypothetical protein
MQQRANRPDPCQPFEKRRIARQLAKLSRCNARRLSRLRNAECRCTMCSNPIVPQDETPQCVSLGVELTKCLESP